MDSGSVGLDRVTVGCWVRRVLPLFR